jgi:cupin fold WbuC family metalloprotein
VIKFKKESDEVLYVDEKIPVIGTKEIGELKRLALLNQRKRVRVCTHDSPNSKLHEMFIVHTKECYVRPHKHIGKDESISVIEGVVDVVLFNNTGDICEVINLDAVSPVGLRYCRLPSSTYHMFIIRTEFLVFHECTQGPFIRNDTIFPEWAPLDGSFKQEGFIKHIESNIRSHQYGC